MMPKRRTPEIEALLDAEARRRADGQSLKSRTRTKQLAAETGLAYGYLANIISRKRREYESKVDVSRGPNG